MGNQIFKVVGVWGLLMGLSACGGKVDWSTSREVEAFSGLSVRVPLPFESADTVDPLVKALGPARELPFRRYYLNYRSTLSGYPEMDAVLVLAREGADMDLQRFVTEGLGRMRDTSWAAAAWTALGGPEGWKWERGVPDRRPLPSTARNQLVRVFRPQAHKGLWAGLVSLERKISAEDATRILNNLTP